MTEKASHLAQFYADLSFLVGRCIYSSPEAQEIERRHNGEFRRAENGEWLFLSHRILTPQERQCVDNDIARLTILHGYRSDTPV